MTGKRNSVAALPAGSYVETVAVHCEPTPYTMPLGLRADGDGRLRFKVYRGTGLWGRLLDGPGGGIVAYSPVDPLDFYRSVRHELESEVAAWGCRVPRERYSLLIRCTPRLRRVEGEAALFDCPGAGVEPGTPAPYTRSYGCLVELLVVYTKARAGALGCGALAYAAWLYWCTARSAPGGRVERAAMEVLRAIRELLEPRCPSLEDWLLPPS